MSNKKEFIADIFNYACDNVSSLFSKYLVSDYLKVDKSKNRIETIDKLFVNIASNNLSNPINISYTEGHIMHKKDLKKLVANPIFTSNDKINLISEMMKNDPFFDVTYIKKKIFGIDKSDERIRTINKILKNG